MFRLSWMQPSKIEGHIKFISRLIGLGFYRDVNGTLWDVHGIFGINNEYYVQARPILEGDFRYSTASFYDGPEGVVTTTWKPYTYEIVEKESVDA